MIKYYEIKMWYGKHETTPYSGVKPCIANDLYNGIYHYAEVNNELKKLNIRLLEWELPKTVAKLIRTPKLSEELANYEPRVVREFISKEE